MCPIANHDDDVCNYAICAGCETEHKWKGRAKRQCTKKVMMRVATNFATSTWKRSHTGLVKIGLMGHTGRTNQRDASAAKGSSLGTMHEVIIETFSNHEGVNTMTISPQSTTAHELSMTPVMIRANEKEKAAFLLFITYSL